MNAPYIPPRRADYIPQVRSFMPGVPDAEIPYRTGLLVMRDRAASVGDHYCDDAVGLLGQVIRMASHYAFASMPLDELREIHRLCVMMVTNASGIEAWHRRRQYREAGGNDVGAA